MCDIPRITGAKQQTRALPTSLGKNMSVTLGSVSLTDSFHFAASSLSKLVEKHYDVNGKYINVTNMENY